MKIDTEREREDLMGERERLTLELDRVNATLEALGIVEAYREKQDVPRDPLIANLLRIDPPPRVPGSSSIILPLGS